MHWNERSTTRDMVGYRRKSMNETIRRIAKRTVWNALSAFFSCRWLAHRVVIAALTRGAASRAAPITNSGTAVKRTSLDS